MKVRVRVTGGAKLRRKMRELRRESAKAGATVGEVGFFQPFAARTAAELEYGRAGPPVLPERPAFRNAVERMRETVAKAGREAAGRSREPERIMEAMVEEAEATLRASYAGMERPPLSPRQARRKRGTPGEGKLFVGTEGPRLLDNIEGRVNGRTTP